MYTAIATTIAGATIGTISRVRTRRATRPSNRDSATAAAVPVVVASNAVSVATRKELPSESSQTGLVKKFSYNRQEKPVGGNWNVVEVEKLIGMTNSVGRMRNAMTSPPRALSHHPMGSTSR